MGTVAVVRIYGLKACDTCRKARQEIESKGKTVEFLDVRETPLSAAEIGRFLGQFGDVLVNRRSTTWRGLSESERAGDPATLLARHPALMKRPVVEVGNVLTLGWDKAARADHLG